MDQIRPGMDFGMMPDQRGIEYDDMNAELKRWELDPSDELETLKLLLEGIPAKENGRIVTDPNTGQVLYHKLPVVNREGAEEIYNFVKQNSTKLISLGFYDQTRLNDMLYRTMVKFCQTIHVNYELWDLEFNHAVQIYAEVYAIIESSYTRALNGNEKVYRGRTHRSQETKSIMESPQEQQAQRPGIIKRMFRKVS